MSDLEAFRWIQSKIDLIITIGKNNKVTLTIEGVLFIEENGLLDAVIKADKTLKQMNTNIN